MRQLFVFVLCIMPACLLAQQRYRLTPPMMQYPSVFFDKQVLVDLAFAYPNTTIRYTLNQKEPTLNNQIYRKPVLINQHLITLKAKVFGNPYLPSETIAATFIQAGQAIAQVEQSLPHPNYPGSGKNALIDLQGGIPQVSHHNWMGYQIDTVQIQLTLQKTAPVKSILLNFLQNESAWIFLPETILVQWFNQATGAYEPFGQLNNQATKPSFKNTCVYQMVHAKRAAQTNQLLIQLLVKKSIPDWHPAKGEHAWMFIDEIKVY
jgi:Fn3 associated